MGYQGNQRVGPDLAGRVREGLKTKLNNQSLLPKVHAILMQGELGAVRKLRRVETLDLGITADNTRWQQLHNDSEHYEVISQKMQTTPSGKTIAVLEYYELGDDQPTSKTLTELRGDI